MSITVCDRVVAAASSNNVNFFMEIFIIASWEIWNLRNSIIFDNGVASIQSWVRRFKAQGYLHLVRVKAGFFYFVFLDSNLRTFFLPPLLVNILCFLK
jgi:hypothetical protein